MSEGTSAFRSIDPDALPGELATYLTSRAGVVRVAVDGAAATDPDGLAARLLEPVQARGRAAVHIRADAFWRDAALRLEYGHTDEYSLVHSWLDYDALRREVLDPLGPDGTRRYLSSLRDPVTNRATREPPRDAAPGTVVVISGQFLLGHGLPFDRTIHLSVSPGALARMTTAELAWTLPAFDRYDAEVAPQRLADVVIRMNHPNRPAIRTT